MSYVQSRYNHLPSRHDGDHNASNVVPEPQPTDRPLTNVDTADLAEETRVVETDEDATEQMMIFDEDLEWISSKAPRIMTRKRVATKCYLVFTHRNNWKDIMLVHQ
jgi:hypothetical protein